MCTFELKCAFYEHTHVADFFECLCAVALCFSLLPTSCASTSELCCSSRACASTPAPQKHRKHTCMVLVSEVCMYVRISTCRDVPLNSSVSTSRRVICTYAFSHLDVCTIHVDTYCRILLPRYRACSSARIHVCI